MGFFFLNLSQSVEGRLDLLVNSSRLPLLVCHDISGSLLGKFEGVTILPRTSVISE